jgi:hypothetical protein
MADGSLRLGFFSTDYCDVMHLNIWITRVGFGKKEIKLK